MHCQYCHSDDHPWFNCRKRPEGWKPAPKPLPTVDMSLEPLQPSPQNDCRPYDQDAVDAAIRGRPRSAAPSEGKTKRAASMRDYMREYRARKKASNQP